MKRPALRQVLLYAGVIAFQAAVFVPVAASRLVDPDEGYYALASHLALHGEIPYADFFYLQMPLLPYLYGIWFEVFGSSYEVGRALSVLLAIGLGVLICRHAVERYGGVWAGIAAVVLYASSNLVFGWYTVTKTYAISTLLLFAAYQLVDRSPGPPPRRWLVAGVLVGLAVDVRLIFVATAPVFAVAAVRSAGAGGAWPKLRGFLGGLAVGLAPNLLFFALGPREYVLGNIGWARLRSNGGLVGDLGQKREILEDLLHQETQFVLLAALALAAVVTLAVLRRRLPLAFWLAGALAAVSILPTPTYTQYFCTSIPFLIFTVLEPLRGGGRLAGAMTARRAAPALAVLAALGFAAVGIGDLRQRVTNSDVGPYALAKLDSIERVRELVDANTAPGERVLSFWPGYLFASHARQWPGFENDIASLTAAAGGYSTEKAHRYRLVTSDELERIIRGRRVRVIVHGPLGQASERPWDEIIRASGYRPIETRLLTTVFLRPGEGEGRRP